MEFKKESLYTLKLEQQELDELIEMLSKLENENALTQRTQRIYNNIQGFYMK